MDHFQRHNTQWLSNLVRHQVGGLIICQGSTPYMSWFFFPRLDVIIVLENSSRFDNLSNNKMVDNNLILENDLPVEVQHYRSMMQQFPFEDNFYRNVVCTIMLLFWLLSPVFCLKAGKFEVWFTIYQHNP